jgi:hypothetical protein
VNNSHDHESPISSPEPEPYTPPPDPIDALIDERGYWWHKDRNKYAMRDGAGFKYPMDESHMLREIAERGFSRSRAGALLSPAEVVLMRIQRRRAVDFVGDLCGRQAGFYMSNGLKILCPKGFTMIESKLGNCPSLIAFWEGLFGKGKNPHYEEQSEFMRGWLKAARISLRNLDAEMKSQIVVLAGPVDCGKSFFQHLITMMLGNRVADPSNCFSKKGNLFNSPLWPADHLQIADSELTEAVQDRHPLIAVLKKMVVTDPYPLTTKFGHEISLSPRWFITISCNDDPISARIIPAPEESFGDKISYCKCYSTGTEFHDGSPEARIAWRKALESELPAFLHAMVDSFVIPEEKKSSRFTIRHFHHPEVVELVTTSMPFSAFGEMLMDWVKNVAGGTRYDDVARPRGTPSAVYGTTAELYRRMGSDVDLKGICNNIISFGTRLGQLAASAKWSKHVSRDKNETWKIDVLTDLERSRGSFSQNSSHWNGQ